MRRNGRFQDDQVAFLQHRSDELGRGTHIAEIREMCIRDRIRIVVSLIPSSSRLSFAVVFMPFPITAHEPFIVFHHFRGRTIFLHQAIMDPQHIVTELKLSLIHICP